MLATKTHPMRTIHKDRMWLPLLSPCDGMHVHRPDLSLHFDLKEMWGNGVRTHGNSKGKIPSTGGSEEDHTCNAAFRTASPTHYRLSYSGPRDQHNVPTSQQQSQVSGVSSTLFQTQMRRACPTCWWCSCLWTPPTSPCHHQVTAWLTRRSTWSTLRCWRAPATCRRWTVGVLVVVLLLLSSSLVSDGGLWLPAADGRWVFLWLCVYFCRLH